MNKNQIKNIFFITVIVLGFGYFLTMNSNSGTTGAGSHDDDVVKSYEIYPGDVVEKIKNNEEIILLDVRTLEEYAEVHLQNALLLPVQELSQQSLSYIGLGEESKNKEIMIYCRSGSRSKTAYDIMKSLGYTNIKSIAGGMTHWEEDNYPYTEMGTYNGKKTPKKGNGGEVSETSPKITIDRTFQDLGVVPQYGDIIDTTFIIKNIGKEILTIGDITTSCSCTSAKVASKTVPAGEETILKVSFNPNFHKEPAGVFKRTVFIPTNDPTSPETEVTIQLDINEGI
ncbi:hypothetical protein A2442_02710 [Candidatus Campbellbacteria bacterium RIFOXYC2_FULL_35_25]|uniref:Rhodanese domain-containing protein n=1 Tax=Candidatus Campbellbacteria bacterium RIFOXYC2_FULL_35_25 TaxID=1797582 RepID=A0A1F5EJ55_9BACT|nr:MAG: hypothetical protein A2442_02710 [Candidatus Campbellbacteria bacterium RIFOXYC2_FULL_35_25]